MNINITFFPVQRLMREIAILLFRSVCSFKTLAIHDANSRLLSTVE